MTRADETEIYAVAALYVASCELSPSMISEELGLQPTRLELKGEQRVLDEFSYHTSENRFILEVRSRGKMIHHESAASLLEQAIDQLLLKIEPTASKLLGLRGVVSTHLLCAFGSTSGIETLRLPATLLQRIAALQLPLTVYSLAMEAKSEKGNERS